MDINPKDIYEKLVKLGTEWAECKYASDLLDDGKKPMISKLGAECPEKSQSAREAHAFAHPKYEEYCKKLAEANKAEAVAKVKYSSAITYADLMRTVAANERATNRSAT